MNRGRDEREREMRRQRERDYACDYIRENDRIFVCLVDSVFCLLFSVHLIALMLVFRTFTHGFLLLNCLCMGT